MNSLLNNTALFKIGYALNQNVRVVGGAVRDYFLNIPPSDIDLATPYLPEKVQQLLEKVGIPTKPTGIHFGTITACCDGQAVEISTLRFYRPPENRFTPVEYTTSYENDFLRRDFTVNALYMDLKGKVYDYSTGLQDLENRNIRFIGNPFFGR